MHIQIRSINESEEKIQKYDYSLRAWSITPLYYDIWFDSVADNKRVDDHIEINDIQDIEQVYKAILDKRHEVIELEKRQIEQRNMLQRKIDEEIKRNQV